MNMEKALEIFGRFAVDGEVADISPFGDGHINTTFRVTCKGGEKYILQQINHQVFTRPDQVMHNILRVTEHLAEKIRRAGGDPMRETLNVIPTRDGGICFGDDETGYYRVFTFVDGARSYPRVEQPVHFYNAARAFARFQNMLTDFPAAELYETIPNFHNTLSRYNDLMTAAEKDLAGRRSLVEKELEFAAARRDKCSIILDALADGSVPVRVTHNDTKYDNILIDDTTGEGICIIDLDTVMPGSMLYDYGDSLRFGTNTGAEDDTDLSRVSCDLELFEQFTRGYLEVLGKTMTPREIELMPLAGQIITLECGMRFLTDFLNGDTYFRIHRPDHNLDRTRAQFRLVEDMEQNYDRMMDIVNRYKEMYC